MMITTFPLFPRLATELRHQIWWESLLGNFGDFGPSIYFYREKRCWCPRLLDESEPGYIPGNGDLNLGFDFHTELLDDDNHFQVPLYFVNREARGIAQAWLQQQGIQIRYQGHKKSLFARPFEPKLDALYIPLDRWDAFCTEPSDRMCEPDLHDKCVDLGSDLERIAIPEALLWKKDEIQWLPETEMWFEHLSVVYVVMDPQPDDMKGPWRWELRDTRGGAFFWSKENDTISFQDGDGRIYSEELYSKMEAAIEEGLHAELIESGLKTLEIRPVYVVKI